MKYAFWLDDCAIYLMLAMLMSAQYLVWHCIPGGRGRGWSGGWRLEDGRGYPGKSWPSTDCGSAVITALLSRAVSSPPPRPCCHLARGRPSEVLLAGPRTSRRKLAPGSVTLTPGGGRRMQHDMSSPSDTRPSQCHDPGWWCHNNVTIMSDRCQADNAVTRRGDWTIEHTQPVSRAQPRYPYETWKCQSIDSWKKQQDISSSSVSKH